MHQPTKVGKQSIWTVVADLEAHAARLSEAIEWTRNVAKGVLDAGRTVAFTNVGPIEPDSREVGIALALPFGGISRDVPVVTLVCTPTPEEMAAMRQETALAGEALRLATLLNWQTQGVRTFETWFVPEATIWQGSPEATQVYLNKTMKAWMTYWFENPPTPLFRKSRLLSIQPVRR